MSSVQRALLSVALLVALPGASLVLAASSAPGQQAAQQRRADRLTELKAAIADIEAGRGTTPLVGEATPGGDREVTFLARRRGTRVPRIVSDVTGWGEHVDGTFDFSAGTMTRVAGTQWYFLDARVAPRARVEYLVAYGTTDYRLDPHNPRQVDAPPASELVLPGYMPPPEMLDPPASPAGTTREVSVESPTLGRACHLVIYTPAGYRPDVRYPVAVFLSGRSGPVARVLDWLISRRAIASIVAVFVVPEAGVAEVPSAATKHGGKAGPARSPADAMRAFLIDELLAWLALRYGVAPSADERALIAISYGARDALDAAVASARQPDCASGEPENPPEGGSPRDVHAHTCGAFGRLGLLVPGRRISSADIAAIGKPRDHRLRVAILAGRYDQANIATARSLRQAFVAAGDAVDYTEVPEGHSPRTWLNNLRVVLVALFGA